MNIHNPENVLRSISHIQYALKLLFIGCKLLLGLIRDGFSLTASPVLWGLNRLYGILLEF